jgi:hypothetical protein
MTFDVIERDHLFLPYHLNVRRSPGETRIRNHLVSQVSVWNRQETNEGGSENR